MVPNGRGFVAASPGVETAIKDKRTIKTDNRFIELVPPWAGAQYIVQKHLADG
jgi:hypothetical protein